MDHYTFEDDKSSSCNDTHGLLDDRDVPARQRKISRWWYLMLFMNFAALLVNTSLVALLYSKEESHCVNDEVKLPSYEYTDSAISWELRRIDDVFHPHNSPYRGNPRKELDLAWQKLMKGFNVRVPSQDWAVPTKPNRTLVRLEDGSNDMMGVPAVLHEIHCLRTIREYMFPEEYPITAKRYPVIPPFMMSVHIADHCLDALRQASMCHADMSLMIHEWWDESPFPQGIPGAPHKCANWDKLTTWFQEHEFDIFKPGMMRHPVTGLEPPWAVALRGDDPSKVHY